MSRQQTCWWLVRLLFFALDPTKCEVGLQPLGFLLRLVRGAAILLYHEQPQAVTSVLLSTIIYNNYSSSRTAVVPYLCSLATWVADQLCVVPLLAVVKKSPKSRAAAEATLPEKKAEGLYGD